MNVYTATCYWAVLPGFIADFASHLAFSVFNPHKFLLSRMAETFLLWIEYYLEP